MIDSIEYRGFEIEIEIDSNSDSPRDWCNIGTFYTWDSRYNSPDENPHSDARAFLISLCSDLPIDCDELDFADLFDRATRNAIILPVYKYEHSNIAYNTGGFSCPWDSGQVGFIWVSLADVRKEYSVKRVSAKLRQRVAGYLSGEVETYSQWVSGSVYGYSIGDDSDIGSCWGFYGFDHDTSGLLEHAEADIDCHIASQRKKRQAKTKTMIKSKVPLLLRPSMLDNAARA